MTQFTCEQLILVLRATQYTLCIIKSYLNSMFYNCVQVQVSVWAFSDIYHLLDDSNDLSRIGSLQSFKTDLELN